MNSSPRDTAFDGRNQLDAFVSLLLECEASSPEEGTRVRRIPKDLLLSPSNPDRFEMIRLGGAEKLALDQLSLEFRRQRAIEWMRNEDLDNALWHLVCEVTLDPKAFRDAGFRQRRILDFMAQVERPLIPHDVLIPIRHIVPPSAALDVGDIRILTATDEVLDPFRHRLFPERLNAPLDKHHGSTMALAHDWGTSTEAIARRARGRVIARLHMLRTYLGQWVAQAERLFQLDDITFVQPAAEAPGCAIHFRSGPEPRSLTVDLHRDRIQELATDWERLQCCTDDLCESVARAHHWIGWGLMEPLPSRRIRDFATALEILLIIDERTAKRAWLAYRMSLLAAKLGKAMLHPTILYLAYDARSDVTHKGRLELQTEQSARDLHDAARDCVRWLVELASTTPDTTRKALLLSLDTPAIRNQVREWLQGFQDPWTAELRSEFDRLWKRYPCKWTAGEP